MVLTAVLTVGRFHSLWALVGSWGRPDGPASTPAVSVSTGRPLPVATGPTNDAGARECFFDRRTQVEPRALRAMVSSTSPVAGLEELIEGDPTVLGEPVLLIGPYASEWGARILMRGGRGRLGQATPPAWRRTRSR